MATQPTNNAVPSESPRDLKFNAGKIDEFVTSMGWQYTDRFGVKHYTIEGLRWIAQQAISAFGYITLKSFQLGAPLPNNELTLPNQILQDETDGEYYRWDGEIPKRVPAGSTPQSTGGVGKGAWVSVGDASLRANLADDGGVELVKNAVDKRGDAMQRLNITGDSTASATGNLVVGNLPIPAGSDAARDAITVSRLIQNGPTNCHAFADKTVIDTATDYGGYGAFDATTVLKGPHTHNHVYSYQDRTFYDGSGILENMRGLISTPSHRGSGTIQNRIGAYINDTVLSGAGNIVEQSGLYIEHLQAAGANVAINVRQVSGLGYYSPFGGKMFQNGSAGFGVDPSVSLFPVNFRGDQLGTFYGFATTDGNGMAMGVTGDNKIQLVAAGETRLQIKQAATFNRAITPGNDNLTPCGDQVNRFSEVHAGTGVINTSDGREKTKPITVSDLSERLCGEDNSDVILDAWGDVSLIAFKWLSAIKEKGDDARWHFGVIAQQVKEAFDKRGIDGTIFGLLCYDEWDDQFDIIPAEVIHHPDEFKDEFLTNEDGETYINKVLIKESWHEVTEPERKVLVTPAGNRWGIRADQCLWLEAAYQRRERNRLDERVKKLEEAVFKTS
ncbi:tail fiber domain-containing protein [Enterobacter sp. Ap-916]|uniref:tail fiber/spike domain-containing protein n=1 Tax=Enterobacteriaceae TaxID=543 RepID=UPI0014237A7B|nr:MULTISPECIES: tail fiber domain-containing protein [unclassified Enterobacter]NIF57546.1 tail fiber domain-containing protein [Enterobacter sp. Ap-867]NIG28511.1 tail fiber domain-containing protein [Enterobacter sp. Ap-916]